MTKVTRLPTGNALGCDDLKAWASRRRSGLSGSEQHEDPRAKWRPSKRRRMAKYLDEIAKAERSVPFEPEFRLVKAQPKC
jgi:hypothetical protein